MVALMGRNRRAEKKVPKKVKDSRFKQWLCNRMGCVSVYEFDEYVEEFLKVMHAVDVTLRKQDAFNRAVGDILRIEKPLSDKERDMYG